MFLAHINTETGAKQSVAEHCLETAKLSAQFAIPELKELCYAAGLLHDIGKYSHNFQRRIGGENIRVDHSTAGAVAAADIYPKIAAYILSLCIAGHHGGIPDAKTADIGREEQCSTLYSRMEHKRKICQEDDEKFDIYKNELTLNEIDAAKLDEFIKQGGESCKTNEEFQRFLIDKISFLIRQVYSCLVDADSIDTGNFCGTRTSDALHMDFEKSLEHLNDKINSFSCETELQKTRRKLQNQAFEKVGNSAEIYLMNMPTGSGKTLCSMKFALERLIRTGKKRIIYVIPYNSIIDQTVTEFENIFGDDAEILRHQSTFSYEDQEDTDEDYRNALKNGTENWDAPLIITTAVQFFESMYSNKRRKLRKLHNISDAILVFDEIHLLPTEFLQACLQAVSYTTRYLNSEAIFLTATMPDFKNLMEKYALHGSKIIDLIDDTGDFQKFEKCRFVNLGEIASEKLLAMADEAPTVLVVTNSKKSARALYQQATGNKFYLSTYLTSVDRQEIIGSIREALEKLENDFPNLENVPETRRIKVFSTSLIEAGVDIDLHTVFRERAGLDSILQSGGRCNREGKRTDAVTYMFDFEDTKAAVNEAANLTKGMFEKYEQISDAACIREYYDALLSMRKDEIISNTLSSVCKKNKCNFMNIPFRSYAESFHLIEERTESILIPQDEVSRELIRVLKFQDVADTRKMQKYTCSIAKWELDELVKQSAADDYGRGIWCLTNEAYYNKKTGICFESTDYIL